MPRVQMHPQLRGELHGPEQQNLPFLRAAQGAAGGLRAGGSMQGDYPWLKPCASAFLFETQRAQTVILV